MNSKFTERQFGKNWKDIMVLDFYWEMIIEYGL